MTEFGTSLTDEGDIAGEREARFLHFLNTDVGSLEENEALALELTAVFSPDGDEPLIVADEETVADLCRTQGRYSDLVVLWRQRTMQINYYSNNMLASNATFNALQPLTYGGQWLLHRAAGLPNLAFRYLSKR